MIADQDTAARASPSTTQGPSRHDRSVLERYLSGWVLAGVVATALVVLLGDLRSGLVAASGAELATMLGLAALTGAGYLSAVPVRYGRSVQSVDLSEAALVAVFVVVPGAPAFLVAGVGFTAAVLRRRHGWVKTAFNLATIAVGLAAALVVRNALLGPAAPLSDRGLLAVAAALSVYGLTGFLAVAGVVARLEGEPLATIVARRRYVFASTIGNIAVGTIGVLIWSVRPEMVLLVAVPLLASTMAYRGASTAIELADRMRLDHDRLERIVRSATDGIALVDADGRVVLWNPSLERLTGVAEEVAVGAHLAHVLPLRDEDEHRAFDPSALLAASEPGSPPVVLDGELVDPESDEARSVRVSVTAVDDGVDRPAGLVVVRDISREREVERLKDDFLMRVSHELRTPLTPIKGYAETLLLHGDRVTPELLRRSLIPISERADHMAELVDDLLLVASIQRRGGLAREVVTVSSRVGERVRAVAPAVAPGRDIRIADTATSRARLDPGGFDRILSILVDNAASYSEPDTAIDIVVRDDGPGVSRSTSSTVGAASRGPTSTASSSASTASRTPCS